MLTPSNTPPRDSTYKRQDMHVTHWDYIRPTITNEERHVNIKSLRRIKVTFGRFALVLFSSFLILNI